jgi:hypothetical protein
MNRNKITISVQNIEGVNRALRQYGDKAAGEISKAINATAIQIMNDVKRAIQGPPKTGTVYTRGNITHRASAPGEAPATDTGALVSSIAYRMERPLSAMVSSRLAYSTYLEFGTRGTNGAPRIRPRPSWVPAVQKNTPLMAKLVEAAIRRAAQ